ncbi:MAG: preprotein translocase subunit SecE [Thermoguttaceae bacterium]
MSELLGCLFSVARYKSGQGKIARRTTMLVVMVAVFCAAYNLFLSLQVVPNFGGEAPRAAAAAVLIGLGCWIAYRAVNFRPFADFLASVEAEMVKVSWPSKPELYSSTVVVLVVFFLLAILVFCCDMVWFTFFKWINVM